VLSADDLAQLEAEVVASIESLVFPAYGKLKSFLESEYLPEARKEAGIWAWPEGEKIYNLTIHFFTSLPLTGASLCATCPLPCPPDMLECLECG
jgi:uncharacterized protein (DUF885 family)